MNTVIYIRKLRIVALTALVIGFAVLGAAAIEEEMLDGATGEQIAIASLRREVR